MKLSRRPRHAARLALFAFCLSLVPFLLPATAPEARAQNAPGATAPIVREIDVQYVGRATVTRERVLAQMRTTVGQPFNQANVEDDIRSLYGTGDVTNVRIFSQPATGGVKVIVIIQTRATIREIVVNGSSRFSARKLQKEITSKKGSTLSEETIEQDRQKLLDYYRDHSFPDVDIQSNVAMDERNNTGVVTFTVNEGGKSVLREVKFEGNRAVKARDLRGAMKDTKGKTFYSLIDKSGRARSGQAARGSRQRPRTLPEQRLRRGRNPRDAHRAAGQRRHQPRCRHPRGSAVPRRHPRLPGHPGLHRRRDPPASSR